MKYALVVALVCSGLVGAQERAAQWPSWRGPLATGEAPQADPPTTWDATTNIQWKVNLPGKGSGTPIVWGENVFVVTAVKTDRTAKPEDLPKVDPKLEKKTDPPTHYYEFYVYCFDRTTGKERWKQLAATKVPHEGHHATHSYAAGSPTTDGKHLYVSFGSFGTYCYTLEGKLVWQADFGRLSTRLGWGEAVTPTLHGDSLLLNWDQEVDSKLICLNAATGKVRWEVPRDEKTSWNAPLVVEHKGTTQVILNGTTRVRSYDLATGKLRWSCAGMTVNAIPSAVVNDGVAYIMSGYRGAMSVAVSLDATGEVTEGAGLLWKRDKGTPYVPSPLLADGKLFFTQANQNQLTILDAKSGKVLLDRERLPNVSDFYASPVAARGRIYWVDRSGTTLVCKLSDRIDVLATNKLNDPIDASPALVGKQLFLRSHAALYCIAAK
jgi:outer membrane protein assembly factor BamB